MPRVPGASDAADLDSHGASSAARAGRSEDFMKELPIQEALIASVESSSISTRERSPLSATAAPPSDQRREPAGERPSRSSTAQVPIMTPITSAPHLKRRLGFRLVVDLDERRKAERARREQHLGKTGASRAAISRTASAPQARAIAN